MKAATWVMGGLLAVVAGAASASTDQPAKAKVAKLPLVTGYQACTAPNAMTQGPFPVPACAPPQRSDAQCGFGNVGTGKVISIASAKGDVKITILARGLQGCEGETLCATSAVRVTTDRCAAGPCTAIDLPQAIVPSDTSCCVVEGGSCKIKTSINSEAFGTLQPGEHTGVEAYGCGLTRVSGSPLPTGNSFVCGLLAP